MTLACKAQTQHVPLVGVLTVCAVTVCVGMAMPVSATTHDDVVVGDFAAGNLTGWQEKVFKGKTRYALVPGDAGMVLMADSQASASGLFREVKIDLQKTPCMTWTWQVDGIFDGLDETSKVGDDYPARVYVVFSGGLAFWNTRAINYVWSNGRPLNSAWPNAFTANSMNVAVQSGPSRVGQWVSQSRNIRADFQALIGGHASYVDGVAIMSDSDNSGRAAKAYYGDVRFTSACES